MNVTSEVPAVPTVAAPSAMVRLGVVWVGLVGVVVVAVEVIVAVAPLMVLRLALIGAKMSRWKVEVAGRLVCAGIVTGTTIEVTPGAKNKVPEVGV